MSVIKHTTRKCMLVFFLVSLCLVSTHILVFIPIKVQAANVVDSFPSPGRRPRGLTWDGQYLWYADSDNKTIFKLNPSTGAVVKSFGSPGNYPSGLAWDGQYLWNVDTINDKIFKLNPSTGAVVDSFDAPGNSPTGLAWDGHYLWNADGHMLSDNAGKIFKLNPSTGAVVDSFDAPGTYPRGLTWDGHYLWNADDDDNKIYKLNPSTGAVANSFDAPGGKPYGLAWDGEYLWHADDSERKIYKIYVEQTTVKIIAISCPDEFETDQSFTIDVTIKNEGSKDAEDLTATIFLPSGFSLTSGSTSIPLGMIAAGETKIVSWTAKASETGDFSITVSISSADEELDYITDTMDVEPSFAYTIAKTTYVGLPLFVWIMLIFAGSGIGLGVVLKKRGKAEKPKEVPLIAPSKTLSIKRGYDTAGQYVKVGIKVENLSPATITDVSVKIDVPSALVRVNPKTGIVELGVIKPSSSQSANFQLTPIRCVDDCLNAIIMFHDATGKLYTQEMKPLELRSVCPMLTGEDVDQERILMALRKGQLKKNKSSLKFKGDPKTAFIMAEARIRGLILLDRDEKRIEDTYVACGCYIGKTKYGEFDFAAEIIVSGKQNEGLLTITVHSNEEAILSGFVYEVLEDVKKHIEITREKIDVVDQACPECGGQLDLSKADEERYLKCELCETLLKLPRWENSS